MVTWTIATRNDHLFLSIHIDCRDAAERGPEEGQSSGPSRSFLTPDKWSVMAPGGYVFRKVRHHRLDVLPKNKSVFVSGRMPHLPSWRLPVSLAAQSYLSPKAEYTAARTQLLIIVIALR